MRTLVDHLSHTGATYGVRKDGSIFVLKDQLHVVEVGKLTQRPKKDVQGHKWVLMDKRWVLLEKRA